MFHSERREVGIGNQVAHRAPAAEHLLKDCPVLVRGLDDAHARLVEPALHTLNGLLESQRTLVPPRIGFDADESVQHRPAQDHRVGAAKLSIMMPSDWMSTHHSQQLLHLRLHRLILGH